MHLYECTFIFILIYKHTRICIYMHIYRIWRVLLGGSQAPDEDQHKETA